MFKISQKFVFCPGLCFSAISSRWSLGYANKKGSCGRTEPACCHLSVSLRWREQATWYTGCFWNIAPTLFHTVLSDLQRLVKRRAFYTLLGHTQHFNVSIMLFILQHALSGNARIMPFDPKVTCKQECIITTFQDVYFVSDSFEEAKVKMRCASFGSFIKNFIWVKIEKWHWMLTTYWHCWTLLKKLKVLY